MHMPQYTFTVIASGDDFEVIGTHYTIGEDTVLHIFDGEQIVASFDSDGRVGIVRGSEIVEEKSTEE